jgi:FkbM family methyltransferase
MIRELRAKVAYALRKRLGFPLEELALARLRRGGLRPNLVFDVGASYGLFADQFWRHWPGTHVHCFEPEPEYVAALKERAAHCNEIHVCAALVGSKAADEATYNFHLGASSILPNTDSALPTHQLRHAKMITLEQYARMHKLVPDFLKLDVQGYELEALKGAEALLPSIEVIFTEVNHIEIYRGAPLAAEMIAWLADRGYALHDICNFMPRPRDGALWQTDMIFVRHSSQLRSSKDWL